MFETKIYFEKSKESFESSILCGENKLYNSWANRAYYSMYILCSIILSKMGINPDGKNHQSNTCYYTHKQVTEQLNFRFRKDKKFNKLKINRLFNDLLNNRGIADYDPNRNVDEFMYKNIKSNFKDAYLELEGNLPRI